MGQEGSEKEKDSPFTCFPFLSLRRTGGIQLMERRLDSQDLARHRVGWAHSPGQTLMS